MRPELIHPMLVHFPIVLIVCLFVTDLVATGKRVSLAGRGPVANASTIAAVAAGVLALLTFAFGDMAYDIAMAAANAPGEALEVHEEAGSVTAIAFAAWAAVRAALWWKRIDLGRAGAWAITAIDGLLVGAVALTAWYGGELVYGHGIAVVKTLGG